MLKKLDILLTCRDYVVAAPIRCCRMFDICQEQITIKLSKKSALTVSQQLSINQQQGIGVTRLALARSCQRVN